MLAPRLWPERLRQILVTACIVTGILWLLGYDVARPGGFLGGPQDRASWFLDGTAEPASATVDLAIR